jgi:methionine synthase I (cobalamin-dependent)
VKGNNDLLVLTQPKAIGEIHTAYLQAGADIVCTNTFNAQRISLADYGMEELSFEMNVAAAKLARASADAMTAKTPDRPRIVAGAMGPTNRTASISPDVNNPGFRNTSYDELVEAYSEQARGLIEGGADVLLIETIFDTLNAKAAGFAALTVFDEMGVELPLLISGTITDRSGRTLSGQTPEGLLLLHAAPQALCARPQLCARRRADAPLHRRDRCRRRHARHRLPQRRPCPTPWASTTRARARWPATWSRGCARGLVNIVGGCCGSTPEHIAEIAAHAAKVPPAQAAEDRAQDAPLRPRTVRTWVTECVVALYDCHPRACPEDPVPSGR